MPRLKRKTKEERYQFPFGTPCASSLSRYFSASLSLRTFDIPLPDLVHVSSINADENPTSGPSSATVEDVVQVIALSCKICYTFELVNELVANLERLNKVDKIAWYPVTWEYSNLPLHDIYVSSKALYLISYELSRDITDGFIFEMKGFVKNIQYYAPLAPIMVIGTIFSDTFTRQNVDPTCTISKLRQSLDCNHSSIVFGYYIFGAASEGSCSFSTSNYDEVFSTSDAMEPPLLYIDNCGLDMIDSHPGEYGTLEEILEKQLNLTTKLAPIKERIVLPFVVSDEWRLELPLIYADLMRVVKDKTRDVMMCTMTDLLNTYSEVYFRSGFKDDEDLAKALVVIENMAQRKQLIKFEVSSDRVILALDPNWLRKVVSRVYEGNFPDKSCAILPWRSIETVLCLEGSDASCAIDDVTATTSLSHRNDQRTLLRDVLLKLNVIISDGSRAEDPVDDDDHFLLPCLLTDSAGKQFLEYPKSGSIVLERVFQLSGQEIIPPEVLKLLIPRVLIRLLGLSHAFYSKLGEMESSPGLEDILAWNNAFTINVKSLTISVVLENPAASMPSIRVIGSGHLTTAARDIMDYLQILTQCIATALRKILVGPVFVIRAVCPLCVLQQRRRADCGLIALDEAKIFRGATTKCDDSDSGFFADDGNDYEGDEELVDSDGDGDDGGDDDCLVRSSSFDGSSSDSCEAVMRCPCRGCSIPFDLLYCTHRTVGFSPLDYLKRVLADGPKALSQLNSMSASTTSTTSSCADALLSSPPPALLRRSVSFLLDDQLPSTDDDESSLSSSSASAFVDGFNGLHGMSISNSGLTINNIISCEKSMIGFLIAPVPSNPSVLYVITLKDLAMQWFCDGSFVLTSETHPAESLSVQEGHSVRYQCFSQAEEPFGCNAYVVRMERRDAIFRPSSTSPTSVQRFFVRGNNLPAQAVLAKPCARALQVPPVDIGRPFCCYVLNGSGTKTELWLRVICRAPQPLSPHPPPYHRHHQQQQQPQRHGMSLVSVGWQLSVFDVGSIGVQVVNAEDQVVGIIWSHKYRGKSNIYYYFAFTGASLGEEFLDELT